MLLFLACAAPPTADTGAEASWQVLAGGLPGALLSIPARSHEHLHLLGSDPSSGPMLYHLDSADWWALPAETTGDLWWGYEWGSSLWAVGDGGRVVHLSEGQLVSETVLDAAAVLFGIWGSGPGDIYAVGSSGGPVMWHFDGEDWSPVSLPEATASHTAIFKVWGRSSDEIWAIGSEGLALHRTDGRWEVIPTPTTESLFTLHGNTDQLYAVGGASEGVILQWTDGGWRDDSPDGAAQLNGIYVRSQGCDPLAVGLYGAVWWRRDGVWEPDEVPTGTALGFHAAWIDPYCDPWVVGGALASWPMSEGVLLYRGDNAPPTLSAAPLPEANVDTEAAPITLLGADCSEDTGWEIAVEFSGMTDGARLTLSDTDDTEGHALLMTSMHPQGYWSQWGLTLPVVPADEQSAGESTRFDCDAALTGLIERLNAGGEPTDCLSWGADPADC